MGSEKLQWLGQGTVGVGFAEATTNALHPTPHPGPTGGSCWRLRSDAAALHIAQPLGAGGARCAAEHGADQPDAERPQPCGLR